MRKILLLMLAMILIAGAKADLPIYVKPLNGTSLQPNTNFTYEFNLTTGSDCSGVVYSNASVIQTGNDGVGFINLEFDNLSGIPGYLCEGRDGDLRKIHQVSEQVFRDLFIRNINASGNITSQGVICDSTGCIELDTDTIWNVDYTWLYNNTGNLAFNSSKLDTIYYNASDELSLVAGTLENGTIDDTRHSDAGYDGVTVEFAESVGSPGLDLRLNFTGITEFTGGVMRYRTSALAGDTPIIQLWSYDEETWEDYPAVGETESYAILNELVYDTSEHLANNTVQMRIYKSTNGNVNNRYYIDWLALYKGFGIPSSTEVDPYSWHKDEPDFTGDYYTDGDVYVDKLNVTSIGWFGSFSPDSLLAQTLEEDSDALIGSFIRNSNAPVGRGGLMIVTHNYSGSTNQPAFGLNAFAYLLNGSLGKENQGGGIAGGRYYTKSRQGSFGEIIRGGGVSSGGVLQDSGAGNSFIMAYNYWAEPQDASDTYFMNATSYYSSAHVINGGGAINNSFGAIFEQQLVGTLTNMEVFFENGGGVYFRDNTTTINSSNAGYMDFWAENGFRFNNNLLTNNATIQNLSVSQNATFDDSIIVNGVRRKTVYNEFDTVDYCYDEEREKWLSCQTFSKHFGRNADNVISDDLRGLQAVILTSGRGYYTGKNVTLIGLTFRNDDATTDTTYNIYAGGSTVIYNKLTGTLHTNFTFDVDVADNEEFAIGLNASPVSAPDRVMGEILYKWRE